MIVIKDVNKIIYRVSKNSAMRFLNSKDAYVEKDMYTLACVIFNIERAIKNGFKISSVRIPISYETYTGRDIDKIELLLNKLFKFVLIENIHVLMEQIDTKKNRRGTLPDIDNYDNICLFSGGIDSLSALLTSKKHFKDVHGVFASHIDQSWGVNIVNNLISEIQKVEDVDCSILYVPEMESRGYSQLRGFLYVLCGAIHVSLRNSKNLIIGECGPTMYQPRFAQLDTVTMTTHPYVMRIAKEIIEIFLKRKVNLILPHENMTKAEVIVASPYKKFFKDSHSCISLRFGRNDGNCYGCVVRRLGTLVAGVKDTKYQKNPLGTIHKNTDVDNLSSLLSFSYDMLINYKSLPYFSKENIVYYNKKDLFKRFSLDNFSALYIYQNEIGKLNDYIYPIYKDLLSIIGEKKIKNRIEKVRNNVFKPNFNRRVR